MKFLYFVPLLLVSAFAAPVEAEDESIPYWEGRVNRAIVVDPVNDAVKALYETQFVGRPELEDCPNFEQINTYSRGDKFTVSIKCNGDMKFADFKNFAIERKDDLEAAPVVDATMMGGYASAVDHKRKLFSWFEPIKGEGCKVNYSLCSVQSFYAELIFKFTCPITCGDETTHPLFVFDLGHGELELESISDSSSMEGFDKLCTMKMKEILAASGQNTEVILSDAGLTSNLEDVTVETGAYLELGTGTQYCMQVSYGDAATIVSLYKFNLEGTSPFIVALPFPDMNMCMDFLQTVSCQWYEGGC